MVVACATFWVHARDAQRTPPGGHRGPGRRPHHHRDRREARDQPPGRVEDRRGRRELSRPWPTSLRPESTTTSARTSCPTGRATRWGSRSLDWIVARLRQRGIVVKIDTRRAENGIALFLEDVKRHEGDR